MHVIPCTWLAAWELHSGNAPMWQPPKVRPGVLSNGPPRGSYTLRPRLPIPSNLHNDAKLVPARPIRMGNWQLQGSAPVSHCWICEFGRDLVLELFIRLLSERDSVVACFIISTATAKPANISSYRECAIETPNVDSLEFPKYLWICPYISFVYSGSSTDVPAVGFSLRELYLSTDSPSTLFLPSRHRPPPTQALFA